MEAFPVQPLPGVAVIYTSSGGLPGCLPLLLCGRGSRSILSVGVCGDCEELSVEIHSTLVASAELEAGIGVGSGSFGTVLRGLLEWSSVVSGAGGVMEQREGEREDGVRMVGVGWEGFAATEA